MNADLLDTIKELKRLILDEHEEQAIALRRGELIYRGKVLADKHTLVYYNIDDGSTLYLWRGTGRFKDIIGLYGGYYFQYLFFSHAIIM